MKIILCLILIYSLSALACPDFSGVYRCPKEAEDHFYFGSRKVQLHYDNNKNTYLLGLGESQTTYYIDTWQPLPGTNTYLKAECSANTLILLEQFDTRSLGKTKEDENISSSLEVSTYSKGLHFKRTYNEIVVFELDCEKI